MKCSMSEIGKRISEMRLKVGLSQDELAKELSVSREVVAKWENGTRDLKTQYTIALADYFGVTCDEILRGVKAENVDINKRLGLTDNAINVLTKLNEEVMENKASNVGFGRVVDLFKNQLKAINYILSHESFLYSGCSLCSCIGSYLWADYKSIVGKFDIDNYAIDEKLTTTDEVWFFDNDTNFPIMFKTSIFNDYMLLQIQSILIELKKEAESNAKKK